MISQWLLRLSAVIQYWLCCKKGERESIPILYKNDCAFFSQEFLRLDDVRQAAQQPWIMESIKSTMHFNQKMKFTLLSDLAGVNYQNTLIAKIQC